MDLGRRVGRGQGVRRAVQRRPAAPGSTPRSPAARTRARPAINRIVGGNPPTAMQFNTGKQFDELVENGLLRDLDDVAAEQKWKDKILPPAILDGDHPRRQDLRRAGQHPRPELALLQHQGLQEGRRRAAQDLGRVHRGRATSSRPPALIPLAFGGQQPGRSGAVQRGAARAGRPGPLRQGATATRMRTR